MSVLLEVNPGSCDKGEKTSFKHEKFEENPLSKISTIYKHDKTN